MSEISRYQVLEKVVVESMSSDGRAVARYGDMVIFIPFAAPGDIIDLKVTSRRKNYLEGVIASIHHFSEDRTEPVCPHFGTCGGCTWQYMKYD
ncbi:MAG: TRAM domain-containing protein, partial [Bacteroidales bacterium]|nr:TRAM domain-containing protein [Bacteroidales bacterium]